MKKKTVFGIMYWTLCFLIGSVPYLIFKVTILNWEWWAFTGVIYFFAIIAHTYISLRDKDDFEIIKKPY